MLKIRWAHISGQLNYRKKLFFSSIWTGCFGQSFQFKNIFPYFFDAEETVYFRCLIAYFFYRGHLMIRSNYKCVDIITNPGSLIR